MIDLDEVLKIEKKAATIIAEAEKEKEKIIAEKKQALKDFRNKELLKTEQEIANMKKKVELESSDKELKENKKLITYIKEELSIDEDIKMRIIDRIIAGVLS